MILPIYTYGTGVLRKTAEPVKELTEERINLIMDMFETMRAADGIGLAATQVGKLERIIVIDISDLDEKRKDPADKHREVQKEAMRPLVFINPEISGEQEKWTMEEGCLSIPDVRGDVERAETIIVRYKDVNFKDGELQAYGLLARVVLHEVDHLNGVLFVDHLTAQQRKERKQTLRDIQRGAIETEYLIITPASQNLRSATSRRTEKTTRREFSTRKG